VPVNGEVDVALITPYSVKRRAQLKACQDCFCAAIEDADGEGCRRPEHTDDLVGFLQTVILFWGRELDSNQADHPAGAFVAAADSVFGEMVPSSSPEIRVPMASNPFLNGSSFMLARA
jgi:hypothetical protein